ncbi:uncharacterized protein IWZ02DRAFT_465605 [Phyllosticta citriasiana]|uniref:Uncharacterized protein n=1 Tax=Phyllosticta citriasiana TaxID=595635 RepID=A0ABR1L0T9_9PEZI
MATSTATTERAARRLLALLRFASLRLEPSCTEMLYANAVADLLTCCMTSDGTLFGGGGGGGGTGKQTGRFGRVALRWSARQEERERVDAVSDYTTLPHSRSGEGDKRATYLPVVARGVESSARGRLGISPHLPTRPSSDSA